MAGLTHSWGLYGWMAETGVWIPKAFGLIETADSGVLSGWP